jgi:hypothetical protein
VRRGKQNKKASVREETSSLLLTIDSFTLGGEGIWKGRAEKNGERNRRGKKGREDDRGGGV